MKLPALLMMSAVSMAMPSVVSAQNAAPVGGPNVIVILADDQGYGDLGCYGSGNKTPNIDRMAAEGARWTDFYVAAPVCTPSRAALLTGHYARRLGLAEGVLHPNMARGLDPKEVTIAEVLKQSGYATACIGKWHLGHLEQYLPTRQGFDSFFGLPYSNDMDRVAKESTSPEMLDGVWADPSQGTKRFNVPLLRDGKVIERPADQRTLTTRYTQEAVNFITANKDRPFFLYLPHSMPHIPLFVADAHHVSDPKLAYRAVTEEIDASTGKILDTLRELKLDRNTLVIYTSDNGPWLQKKHHGGSAGPLRQGKATTWEGGMRVPCIMWWPGHIEAGRTIRDMATTMDLLPTLARACGGQVPTERPVDGVDVGPSLWGGAVTAPARPPFLYYSSQTGEAQAIRDGRWKLIMQNGKPQLYDLVDDIGEKSDVAGANPDVVERLGERMKAMAAAIEQDRAAR